MSSRFTPDPLLIATLPWRRSPAPYSHRAGWSIATDPVGSWHPGRVRAMVALHVAVGITVIVVCFGSALLGFLAYRRAGTGGAFVSHALILAQTLLIAQAAVGLLLLSEGRRAPEKLHYSYGALALGLVLVPWFYAPGTGSKRLLWFAVTTLVAGGLAVRAFMTGS
jgi:hypothetical protein